MEEEFQVGGPWGRAAASPAQLFSSASTCAPPPSSDSLCESPQKGDPPPIKGHLDFDAVLEAFSKGQQRENSADRGSDQYVVSKAANSGRLRQSPISDSAVKSSSVSIQRQSLAHVPATSSPLIVSASSPTKLPLGCEGLPTADNQDDFSGDLLLGGAGYVADSAKPAEGNQNAFSPDDLLLLLSQGGPDSSVPDSCNLPAPLPYIAEVAGDGCPGSLGPAAHTSQSPSSPLPLLSNGQQQPVHAPSPSERHASAACSDESSQLDALLDFFSTAKRAMPSCLSATMKTAIQLPETRPVASVSMKELEDVDKKSVFVIYQGLCTPVSWFADLPSQDVREMILCSCDAIIDGGFVLREIREVGSNAPAGDGAEVFEAQLGDATLLYVRGARYEFEEYHKLVDGGLYLLEPATERTDLQQYTGNRRRRLTLETDPLKHVEAQKALKVMKQGANLLKHTHGFPHLRQFQLSTDLRRLLWYSTDSKEKTMIHVRNIKGIRLGQTSHMFQKYKLSYLEHLAFSVVYDNSDRMSPLSKTLSKMAAQIGTSPSTLNTLDLTCKDEVEFDHWVAGFKALICANHGMLISKQQLLSHSRRFRRALEANDCGIKLTALPPIKGPGTMDLEGCLELPVHSFVELEKKHCRLQDGLAKACKKIALFDEEFNMSLEKATELCGNRDDIQLRFNEEAAAENGTDSQWDPHTAIFTERAADEDHLLEYIRMRELVGIVEELLSMADKEIKYWQDSPRSSGGSPKDPSKTSDVPLSQLKQINQLLWKAEVDYENIEDMLKRLADHKISSEPGSLDDISRRFAIFNAQVTQELEKVGDKIANILNQFLPAEEQIPPQIPPPPPPPFSLSAYNKR